MRGGTPAGWAGGKARPAGRKLARGGRAGTLPSMWSLLKAGLVLGALAAFLFLLPFGGRTLAGRWRAADGAADFATRTWAEMRGVPAPARAPPTGVRPRSQARAGEPPGTPPVEGHTEQDRQALDRLLGEHLADAPKR